METKKKMSKQLKEFVFDLSDVLTVEEIIALQNCDNYDDFHTMCLKNDLVHMVKARLDLSDDKLDEYIAKLDTIVRGNVANRDNEQEIVEDINQVILKDDRYKHTVIYSYLKTSSDLRDFLLREFGFLGLKCGLITAHNLSLDWTVEYGSYDTRFQCDCGYLFKHKINQVDLRSALSCCSQCGRCSSTWKLVSSRTITLIRTTKKKRRLFGTKITTEKIDWGADVSDHVMFDSDAEKYTAPTKVSDLPEKPTNTTTIKDSM
jgi:hypothetical protein